jgi:hypothetical protein
MVAKFRNWFEVLAARRVLMTIVAVAAMLVVSGRPGYSQCPLLSRFAAIVAHKKAVVAVLKQTGNCALLDQIIALDIQSGDVCRAGVAQYPSQCWCQILNAPGPYERKTLGKYCREQKPTQTVANQPTNQTGVMPGRSATNSSQKSSAPGDKPRADINSNDQKSIRREGSSRDAGACSDAMTNCGGSSESMPLPGPAQIPWGFRNQSPYKGCTTLAPCSQPQLPPPGIDLAEAKRIDEIRLQQYSNVYRDEKLYWQAVQAILEGLSAEPPDFGSAIEKAAEDYQAQEIKRTMPDYMTDEEIVDEAIDELAANKMAGAIKNDPSATQPVPNAQELWDKIENALTVQDAPAASSPAAGPSAGFPPPN